MQIEIQIVRRCHIIKPTPHSGVAENQKTITKAKKKQDMYMILINVGRGILIN